MLASAVAFAARGDLQKKPACKQTEKVRDDGGKDIRGGRDAALFKQPVERLAFKQEGQHIGKQERKRPNGARALVNPLPLHMPYLLAAISAASIRMLACEATPLKLGHFAIPFSLAA